MKVTEKQLKRIRELSSKVFKRNTWERVDTMCRANAHWNGWVYTGLENMSHTEAGWLVAELEIRARNQ